MPDTPDPGFFWDWISKQQNPLSGVGLGRYWHLVQPTTEALNSKDISSVDHDAITSKLNEQLSKITMHWAQSGKGPDIKISSIEWAITSALKGLPEKAA